MTTATRAPETRVDVPTAPVLAVTGLTVASADRTLVHGVDFAIERGERVGLIGESGSGKSLTSQAVFGLLGEGLHAAGQVRLAGRAENLIGIADAEIRRLRGDRMAMVFQEPMTALNPLMRIGKQVGEVIRLHTRKLSNADVTARTLRLLDEVGLPDPDRALRAYPHELSGGQRQRVVIAMALANNPSLIIADEPTTALDVTVQAQVLALLDEATSRHDAAMLFITHDLSVVATICDRVLVMLDGRIVEEGTVEQVLTAPQHPYTRGLVAASDLTKTDADGHLFTVASSQTVSESTTTTSKRFDSDRAGALAGASSMVEISRVTRTYGHAPTSFAPNRRQVKALKGVDLDIRRGERFGIVGESGSGKSTLIRMVAGLDQPTTGRVVVDGDDITGLPERRLRGLRDKVQFVFQDPMSSLDPRMTVRQIIQEPLHSNRHNDPDQRVRELLEAVDLPASAADRFPHQFSGGQRQRISIARALAPNPSILIADEPVSALDVSVRAQVLNLLNDLVDEFDLTLLFVSHDLGVVRYLCDRVAVLLHGELIEVDTTKAIYSDAAASYTKDLIAASSSLDIALERRLARSI